jgi:hypothetical protein
MSILAAGQNPHHRRRWPDESKTADFRNFCVRITLAESVEQPNNGELATQILDPPRFWFFDGHSKLHRGIHEHMISRYLSHFKPDWISFAPDNALPHDSRGSLSECVRYQARHLAPSVTEPEGVVGRSVRRISRMGHYRSIVSHNSLLRPFGIVC